MKPYVLIAEDESAVSELLQYNLKREDYEVAIANDGEEALLMMEERAPDLLLLDWMLPKVSGIEVCRRVRSGGANPNLPIIMLTARGEESDRIRGLDTGADDYVTKPFSTTELMARVRAVLRRIRPGLRDDKVIVGDIEFAEALWAQSASQPHGDPIRLADGPGRPRRAPSKRRRNVVVVTSSP